MRPGRSQGKRSGITPNYTKNTKSQEQRAKIVEKKHQAQEGHGDSEKSTKSRILKLNINPQRQSFGNVNTLEKARALKRAKRMAKKSISGLVRSDNSPYNVFARKESKEKGKNYEHYIETTSILSMNKKVKPQNLNLAGYCRRFRRFIGCQESKTGQHKFQHLEKFSKGAFSIPHWRLRNRPEH